MHDSQSTSSEPVHPERRQSSNIEKDDSPSYSWHISSGVFVVSLCTLAYQLILTRITSSTIYYHFAFAVISIALFGLAIGAIVVYLFPRIFSLTRTLDAMALSCTAFAVGIPLSLWLYFEQRISFASPLETLGDLLVIYVLFSVPFVFSGICVTLVLTRFPKHIGKLYAADLIGAGAGCIGWVFLLYFVDAVEAILFLAICAATTALIFARHAAKFSKSSAWIGVVLTVTLLVAQVSSQVMGTPLLRIKYLKGSLVSTKPVFERWNAFSHVTVQSCVEKRLISCILRIDSGASTRIMEYPKNRRDLQFLDARHAYAAHRLRRDARVCVIGVGGGRDILAALYYGQKDVLGIEINESVLEALTEEYYDLTSGFVDHPKVTLVNDEARSYLASRKHSFDIIQYSMIDTWAATAAGAYVLTENALYTVESMKMFLERLTPRGILSITRHAWESPRLISLTKEALRVSGAKNPRKHMIALSSERTGLITLLVSNSLFTRGEVRRLQKFYSNKKDITVFLGPGLPVEDPLLRHLLLNTNLTLEEGDDRLLLNLSPPTDDKPFFFNMQKFELNDFLDLDFWRTLFLSKHFNRQAVEILALLMLTTLILTSLIILLPLCFLRNSQRLRFSVLPYLTYFLGLGLGFMLIEVSLMQRLMVVLGHPTYALTVVLFTLLLSSGAGSYCSASISQLWNGRGVVFIFSMLLFSLVSVGGLTGSYMTALSEQGLIVRIIVSSANIALIGFFMGMLFPTGMRKVEQQQLMAYTPWFWGINGAASVLATVLATSISMSNGISITFWTGVCVYGVIAGTYAVISCLLPPLVAETTS